MQRTNGRLLLVAGVLAVAACTPGEDVSEDTAVPTASTEPTDSSTDASTGSAPAEEPQTLPPVTLEPSETTFALPGLVDPSDEPIANDDDVRTGTLDNGLQYYVRHNDRPGAKASLRLAVHAGSVDEIGPSTGVAHFVEHMMFNGTEEYPENELIDVPAASVPRWCRHQRHTSFDETVRLDV
jgi:zinc protease